MLVEITEQHGRLIILRPNAESSLKQTMIEMHFLLQCISVDMHSSVNLVVECELGINVP